MKLIRKFNNINYVSAYIVGSLKLCSFVFIYCQFSCAEIVGSSGRSTLNSIGTLNEFIISQSGEINARYQFLLLLVPVTLCYTLSCAQKDVDIMTNHEKVTIELCY